MGYLPLLQSERLAIFDDLFGGNSRVQSGKAVVPIDVESDEQAVHIRSEIPGVRKEDIVIEYQDGVLAISGEKSAQVRKSENAYHYTEISVGTFSRKIQVGRDLNFALAEASYENGVLHVSIPREKQAPVNRLLVK